MFHFQFEELVDDGADKPLVETARKAGAWMRSRGLHVSHGYNEILRAKSIDDIKRAVIDHCGDHDAASQDFLSNLK